MAGSRWGGGGFVVRAVASASPPPSSGSAIFAVSLARWERVDMYDDEEERRDRAGASPTSTYMFAQLAVVFCVDFFPAAARRTALSPREVPLTLCTVAVPYAAHNAASEKGARAAESRGSGLQTMGKVN